MEVLIENFFPVSQTKMLITYSCSGQFSGYNSFLPSVMMSEASPSMLLASSLTCLIADLQFRTCKVPTHPCQNPLHCFGLESTSVLLASSLRSKTSVYLLLLNLSKPFLNFFFIYMSWNTYTYMEALNKIWPIFSFSLQPATKWMRLVQVSYMQNNNTKICRKFKY